MKYNNLVYFTPCFMYLARVEIYLTSNCQIKKAQPKIKLENIHLPGALTLQRPKMVVVRWTFAAFLLWHSVAFVGFDLLQHRL